MKCMAREDFEEDEVLKVMKDLCGDMSLGPDVFRCLFFFHKVGWNFMKEDIKNS